VVELLVVELSVVELTDYLEEALARRIKEGLLWRLLRLLLLSLRILEVN
jgi:hypothetical protein